jgi:hypothetical protein
MMPASMNGAPAPAIVAASLLAVAGETALQSA